MRIDRYVGGLFLGFYALAFFLLVGLFVVFDAIGHADEYLEVSRKIPEMTGLALAATIARYYALSVPFYYLQVAPFVTLLAAAFTANRLQRSGELVPMVAGGRSLQRVCAPIFLGGVLAAGFMVLAREGTVRRLRDLRETASNLLRSQRTERVYENFAVPMPGGGVLLANRFLVDRDRLEGVRIFPGGGARAHTFAAAMEYREEGPRGAGWVLEGGRIARFVEEGADVEGVDFVPGEGIAPRDVLLAYKGVHEPLDLSFSEVNRLAARDPDRLPYQTLLHYFLTFPLANLILPLLGLPFCLRLDRRAGAEGIAAACLLCAAYFGADVVLRDLGGRGVVGPLVGSWSPVVLFGSLGIVLFDGMKT